MNKLCTFLVVLFCQFSISQQTYYISTNGNDANERDGLSPATAWKTLAYSADRIPEGNHTLQLGEGTFVISSAINLKSGWTLNGKGHKGNSTTTLINSSTFGPEGAICLGLSNEKNDYPLENYLLGGNGLENVTIGNLILTSRESNPLDGGIMMKYVKNLEIFNVTVKEFRWNGIYLRQGTDVHIHDSDFYNATYERLCNTWGGSLRTRYMKNFELDRCKFETTKGGGYGYKASGHENAKVHHNTFLNNTSLEASAKNRPFDLESAHEFEWGLEIYENVFNGMVSVPRSGNQRDPSDRGDYTYTVRIHNNVFNSSAGVEGPRNFLEIDHNYFSRQLNNGRVYEIHGGQNSGPTKIHHNVAECTMGFVFKKNELNANMYIYNNTVILFDGKRNNFPASFLEVSGAIDNWQVKNNIVMTLPGDPVTGTAYSRGSIPSSGMVLSNNVGWNVPNTGSNTLKEDPGLKLSGAKPGTYYAPLSAMSFVVDRGAEVGFAKEGSAPDIGAYEWSENSTTDPQPDAGPVPTPTPDPEPAPTPEPAPDPEPVPAPVDTDAGNEEPIVEELSLKFYPNPVNNLLEIGIADDMGPAFIRIHDLMGHVLINKELERGESVKVDQFAKGIYIIQLNQGEEFLTGKLIKN